MWWGNGNGTALLSSSSSSSSAMMGGKVVPCGRARRCLYCWCTLPFLCCTLLYSIFGVVFIDHGEQREADTEAVVHTACYSCRVFAGVPYSCNRQPV